MAGPAALGQSVRAISRGAAMAVAVLLAHPDHAMAGQAGAVPPGSPEHPPTLSAAAPTGGGSHVRGLDPRARELIQKATQASPTVAALIAALDRTDVLVLVQVTVTPRKYTGITRLLGSGEYRAVLVSIDSKQFTLAQIVWLGHELQHAQEIADAGDVRDEAALRRLMERIGWATGLNRTAFETDAALAVGWQVRREAAAAVASSRK
jgi:hypothetical protein